VLCSLQKAHSVALLYGYKRYSLFSTTRAGAPLPCSQAILTSKAGYNYVAKNGHVMWLADTNTCAA